jgi:hypothetical protein
MGAAPASTCGRASSTYTYTSYVGNNTFASIKTAANYISNASTNTYGWIGSSCSSGYAYVCEFPIATSFPCPTSPPPAAPSPPLASQLCEHGSCLLAATGALEWIAGSRACGHAAASSSRPSDGLLMSRADVQR